MSSLAWLWIILALFIIVSTAMVLIILVQRPQGGGLAGAFGGAGGTGADTVFGGRVGDALSWATVTAFVLYLLLALGMNIIDDEASRGVTATATPASSSATPETAAETGAPEPASGEKPPIDVKDIRIETEPARPAPEPVQPPAEPGAASSRPEGSLE